MPGNEELAHGCRTNLGNCPNNTWDSLNGVCMTCFPEKEFQMSL